MRKYTPKEQKLNRAALADLIEFGLTDAQFYMRSWTNNGDPTECGTTGCALGWAAMSRIIPGLGYKKLGGLFNTPLVCNNDGTEPSQPGWAEAGQVVFGKEAYRDVFVNGDYMYNTECGRISRKMIADHLRRI